MHRVPAIILRIDPLQFLTEFFTEVVFPFDKLVCDGRGGYARLLLIFTFTRRDAKEEESEEE